VNDGKESESGRDRPGWDSVRPTSPIGSGPMEAMCKTTWRLKGPGMRWDSPNAEVVMALAALDQSGHWTGSWQTCLKPTG
jgi:hypothetical protein